jgi:hypothetical protein
LIQAKRARVTRGLFGAAASTGVIRSQFMMDVMSDGMMIGMGLIWLLVIVFLVLGIAAAIKYLRS